MTVGVASTLQTGTQLKRQISKLSKYVQSIMSKANIFSSFNPPLHILLLK